MKFLGVVILLYAIIVNFSLWSATSCPYWGSYMDDYPPPAQFLVTSACRVTHPGLPLRWFLSLALVLSSVPAALAFSFIFFLSFRDPLSPTFYFAEL